MELELEANQDSRVRLGFYGGVVTFMDRKVTVVSPMGALVQMFNPFKLVDAKLLTHGMYCAGPRNVSARAAAILELSFEDFIRLNRYLQNVVRGYGYPHIIEQLRTLK